MLVKNLIVVKKEFKSKMFLLKMPKSINELSYYVFFFFNLNKHGSEDAKPR